MATDKKEDNTEKRKLTPIEETLANRLLINAETQLDEIDNELTDIISQKETEFVNDYILKYTTERERINKEFTKLKEDIESVKTYFKSLSNNERKDEINSTLLFEIIDKSLMVSIIESNDNFYKEIIEKLKGNKKPKHKTETENKETKTISIKPTQKQIDELNESEFTFINLTDEQQKQYKEILKDSVLTIAPKYDLKDINEINLDELVKNLNKQNNNANKINKLLDDIDFLSNGIMRVSGYFVRYDSDSEFIASHLNENASRLLIKANDELLKTIELETEIKRYFNISDYPEHTPQDLKERLKKEKQQINEIVKYIANDNIDKIKDFKPINAKSLITINDKVTNELKRLEKDKETEILNIRGYNNPYQDEKVKVMIQNAKVKTNQVLTPFDLMILNSIYTLTQNNEYFDVAMIKKHLTQQDRKVKSKLDDDIKASIEKMRVTIVTLELTDYLNDSYKNPLSKKVKDALKVGSYLLPIKNVSVTKGGVEKVAYLFIEKPLYFEYAKMQNQLITSDVKLLDVPITNTNDNILIKTYIAKRVSDMKYHNEKNDNKSIYKENTINVDTLFDELDLLKDDISENTYNVKRKRYYAVIEEILFEYRKKKIIKNYNVNRGVKNSIKSYTIIF